MSNLIRSRTSRVTAVLATAAVAMGMVAGPASAQTRQEGLVNVNVEDVVVQVPIAVAANVCGVDIVALAQNTEDAPATCTADADAVPRAFRPNGPGNGGPGQAPGQQ